MCYCALNGDYLTVYLNIFNRSLSLSLNATELLKLDHPWCRTFMKIFTTFDNTVIKQCQYFTSVLPIGYYYLIHKVTSIKNLLFTNNVMILTLYNTVAKSEISTCAVKFKCEEQNFNWKYRSIVHDHFKGELGL